MIHWVISGSQWSWSRQGKALNKELFTSTLLLQSGAEKVDHYAVCEHNLRKLLINNGSAGLTHKHTTRTRRAPSGKGAPSKSG